MKRLFWIACFMVAASVYAAHPQPPTGTEYFGRIDDYTPIMTNTAEFVSRSISKATNAIPSVITNIVRDTVGTVWDAKLGVAWEARMHNGHLYYIAVTNQPPVTGKEE